MISLVMLFRRIEASQFNDLSSLYYLLISSNTKMFLALKVYFQSMKYLSHIRCAARNSHC